ncbi:hypothetical protein ACWC2T_35325 [Streptomyces sp. NPDC001393]
MCRRRGTAFFDYEGGFLDQSTLVVGTVESDEEFGTGRQWLVDTARMRLTDRLTYPFEVSGLPKALGDGTRYTVSDLDNALHVWALQRRCPRSRVLDAAHVHPYMTGQRWRVRRQEDAECDCGSAEERLSQRDLAYAADQHNRAARPPQAASGPHAGLEAVV